MYKNNFYHSDFQFSDCGPEPFVTNISADTNCNNHFRTTIWTGKYLQATLMCIDVCQDIGVEMHSYVDQFLKVESGTGVVKMGPSKTFLNYQCCVCSGSAIFIPAGTWHNLINTGNLPIKLYSVYAPPNHPHGTVHETKAIAEAAENH